MLGRGGEPLGLNPRIRIYRYKKGQFFDCHCPSTLKSVLASYIIVLMTLDDESNMIELPTTPKPTPARTTWTLLLYLTSPTEGCLGGETVFYPDDPPGKNKVAAEPIVVGLETGMLLLHKHGSDCMLVSDLQQRRSFADLIARGTRSACWREVGHTNRSLCQEMSVRS